MTIQIVLALTTQLLLPAYVVWTVWRSKERDRGAWIVKAAYCSTFLIFLIVAGRWDWWSVHLRFLWAGLLGVALIASYRRVRHMPWSRRRARMERLNLWSELAALALFVSLLVLAGTARTHDGQAVSLELPLRDGRYYVVHGGDGTLINHHHPFPPQRHALDIVALNAAGLRARGVYPSELDRYVIFGATVYSPCDGVVAEAVDDLPDQIPPRPDPANPAGNHVVIACRGVEVLLAHLRRGSVRVTAGQSVTVDDPLGEVGNSGNTSEPHLHIHAERANRTETSEEKQGVPLSFEGTYPVRNTVLAPRGIPSR